VLICFRYQIFRANRCTKVDNFGLDCFKSPNYPVLGRFGVKVEINWDLVINQDATKAFVVFKDIPSKNSIVFLKFHPNFSIRTLKALLDV